MDYERESREPSERVPWPYTLSESMASAYVGRKLPEWVMVVSCYLDDSRGERREAIAGYLGPLGIWERRFTPVWETLLESAPHELDEYKASDARQMKGSFHPDRGWTRDEVNEYAIRAVHTLSDASKVPELYGLGVGTIVPPTHDDADHKGWTDQGYVACFWTLLINVIAFLRRWRPPVTRLQIVHDEQEGLEGQLFTAFKTAKKMVADDCSFSISNLQFEDSKELLPLQAADMLAYETRKELVNRLDTPQRCRSRALIHFLENRTHAGFYLDITALEDWVENETVPPVLYKSDNAQEAS